MEPLSYIGHMNSAKRLFEILFKKWSYRSYYISKGVPGVTYGAALLTLGGLEKNMNS